MVYTLTAYCHRHPFDGRRWLEVATVHVRGHGVQSRLKSMGLAQWFNASGAALAVRVVLGSRATAVPHIRARDVSAVDFETLRKAGVTGVVFDKDNTLTFP